MILDRPTRMLFDQDAEGPANLQMKLFVAGQTPDALRRPNSNAAVRHRRGEKQGDASAEGLSGIHLSHRIQQGLDVSTRDIQVVH